MGAFRDCTCGHSKWVHRKLSTKGHYEGACALECGCLVYAERPPVLCAPPGPTEPFGGYEKPLGVDR
jgi:hypothetical protein